VQAGAIPRFADVNLDDHCLSVASAEHSSTERTKAIMPVHLYGNVADMDPIKAFASATTFRHRRQRGSFLAECTREEDGHLGEIAGCSFLPEQNVHHGWRGWHVTTTTRNSRWIARSFPHHGVTDEIRM